jgi:NADH-quinone oxidoreductase subunit L
MALSVGIGLFGIALAYLIYLRGTLAADTFSSLAMGIPYRWLYHKYYVDELYQLTFVRGTLFFSRVGAWIDQHIIDFIVDGSAKTTALISWINGLFDNYVVDWLVNMVADSTLGAGDKLRKIQTGNINSYLYVVLGAVVVAIVVKLKRAYAYGLFPLSGDDCCSLTFHTLRPS